MSWLANNYEKAALGGSVVAALALAYLGWSAVRGVEDDFAITLTGGGNNDPSIRDSDAVPKAAASMALDRSWTQAEFEGRKVDLFTGIPLFVTREAPDKPVDLIKDGPIHPPIPNSWWLENRLDPGYADSPSRDPDEDGFTNLEEFKAGTDPTDLKSHPPLIAKLMYVKDESLTWVLRPGFKVDESFSFKYEDNKRQMNNAGAAAMVAPGDLFFTDGVMKERFKLLGSEVRQELNPNLNIEVEITIVRVEDMKPNKKGVVYEIPAPLPDARKNQHLNHDRSAVFTLEAVGLSGREFKVEENTAFALPPDAPNKDYHLRSVTPEEVVVEYRNADGSEASVTIGKGTLPQIQP
jgi:hypothetical protein